MVNHARIYAGPLLEKLAQGDASLNIHLRPSPMTPPLFTKVYAISNGEMPLGILRLAQTHLYPRPLLMHYRGMVPGFVDPLTSSGIIQLLAVEVPPPLWKTFMDHHLPNEENQPINPDTRVFRVDNHHAKVPFAWAEEPIDKTIYRRVLESFSPQNRRHIRKIR